MPIFRATLEELAPGLVAVTSTAPSPACRNDENADMEVAVMVQRRPTHHVGNSGVPLVQANSSGRSSHRHRERSLRALTMVSLEAAGTAQSHTSGPLHQVSGSVVRRRRAGPVACGAASPSRLGPLALAALGSPS